VAGTVDFDPERDPLGTGRDGRPVFLRDVWPTPAEVSAAMAAVKPELFREEYARVSEGDEHWRSMPVPAGDLYAWDPASTYIKRPPFFEGMGPAATPPTDVRGARVLALLGDSITTDHISPAGSIPADAPAGRYLISLGVEPKDFNSYGARRGNHEVMCAARSPTSGSGTSSSPGSRAAGRSTCPAGDAWRSTTPPCGTEPTLSRCSS